MTDYNTDYSTDALRGSTRLRAFVLAWMRTYAEEHTDPETGEVDHTALVEDWDRCCADGGATLDPDHPAWEIALLVG